MQHIIDRFISYVIIDTESDSSSETTPSTKKQWDLAIVKSLMALCADLGITAIAEGIETADERDWLADAGIRLMQGYLFARPAFQAIGRVADEAWPAAAALR